MTGCDAPLRPPSEADRRHDSSVDRLFRALRDGDERALQALLPPLRERLLRLARSSLREQAAEDVVQETLKTVWEKRAAILSADHFLRFVFRTFRYKSANAQYQARRDGRRAGAAGPDHLPSAPSAAHPGVAFESRELHGVLETAIRACAEENGTWGQVLRLLRDGHSQKEIRTLLGDIPTATLYTRIFRARKRLKEILETDHDLEL